MAKLVNTLLFTAIRDHIQQELPDTIIYRHPEGNYLYFHHNGQDHYIDNHPNYIILQIVATNQVYYPDDPAYTNFTINKNDPNLLTTITQWVTSTPSSSNASKPTDDAAILTTP